MIWQKINTITMQQGSFNGRQTMQRMVATSSVKRGQLYEEYVDMKAPQRTDDEWVNAKAYKTLTGPTRLGFFRSFLPGGEFHNVNFVDLSRALRARYGDFFVLRGMMGRADMIFTYNAEDFQKIFRTEGMWPVRINLESFIHYRKVKRPELFKGTTGLVTDQGEIWADMRNKVNPILMKTQVVRQDLPQIDAIATELIERLEQMRDPHTGLLNGDLHNELKMWSFEAVSYIALNTRMNVFNQKANKDALTLMQCMNDFFKYSFQYDVAPFSFWKYIETPGFKRLMRTYDTLTEITSKYVHASIERIEKENNKEAKSILERLLRIDKHIAFMLVIDTLTAGMDTTTSSLIFILYHIAKNPEKQDLLRQELLSIMPSIDTPLTQENTKNLPYLRACMKEALRITPIVPGTMRTLAKDMVLSGYQVPRGTGVHMANMALCNSDEYFPKSNEFIPERWLKTGKNVCPELRTTNPFVYSPFGFGPRTCVGKRVAEMEIETFLARLLRRYKVSWVGERDISVKSLLILMPMGKLEFKFEPL